MTNKTADPGMELRDLLSDASFRERRGCPDDPARESIALRQLAKTFAEDPERVLQELVDAAVTFCHADSAGISLQETGPDGKERFRWIAVSGSFEPYLHGTTPRDFSPCGTCMDRAKPQLYIG